MHDSAGHRESRDARRADHGVDLFLEEEVEEFGEEHAASGVEDEGDKAEKENEERVELEEALILHLGGDGDTEEYGDEVCKHLLSGLRE